MSLFGLKIPDWACVLATVFAGTGIVFRALGLWDTPKLLLYAASAIVLYHQWAVWAIGASVASFKLGPGSVVMGVLGFAIGTITYNLPYVPPPLAGRAVRL